MTTCKSCGKEHGMVIENRKTGEETPIDYCSECLFKECRYNVPEKISPEILELNKGFSE